MTSACRFIVCEYPPAFHCARADQWRYPTLLDDMNYICINHVIYTSRDYRWLDTFSELSPMRTYDQCTFIFAASSLKFLHLLGSACMWVFITTIGTIIASHPLIYVVQWQENSPLAGSQPRSVTDEYTALNVYHFIYYPRNELNYDVNNSELLWFEFVPPASGFSEVWVRAGVRVNWRLRGGKQHSHEDIRNICNVNPVKLITLHPRVIFFRGISYHKQG